MSSLTINIDEKLKKQVKKRIKKEGLNFTFLINEALKAYNKGKLKFELLNKSDDKITASFDVSTKKGKKDCLNSFKSLIKNNK